MKLDAATLTHGHLRRKLAANLARRQRAARELADARDELELLLRHGLELSSPMTVTEMCEAAAIRREHGHQILRGHGRPRFLNNELEG